ncbi:uncharacterized protein J3D65DRAFT_639908 [Phyllosticta citribraziliensis]|uniref:Uncharacterized protein n=1 Tax=Phyllosticta citribraziliensis TaxID=989973 RepID=A0ABR1L6N6_9PEZI
MTSRRTFAPLSTNRRKYRERRGKSGSAFPAEDVCPMLDQALPFPQRLSYVELATDFSKAIQVQEQHEVGTTWEQGKELSIGISYIVSAAAAISISVAETVTDSIAETGSLTCPVGRWHCSLMVYPSMIRLRGHVKKLGPNDKCDGGEFSSDTLQDGATWVLVLPRKDASGNGFWGVEVCTCVNLKYAKDEGHPKVECSEDCAQTGAP